jgi:DNA-binding response OmpR family regulator
VSGRPTVLFAHERPAVRRAVERVLERSGFAPTCVADGARARAELEDRAWAAFAVDVGLPGLPGYELLDVARRLHRAGPRPPTAGAEVTVLVASVYRKTSYKRRPTRLYGADDYVEIHHLGDQLPAKLWQHLQRRRAAGAVGFAGGDGSRGGEGAAAHDPTIAEALEREADARFVDGGAERLAALIVADMVLYAGEQILGARSYAEARAAVELDLDIARDLFRQVLTVEGAERVDADAVDRAFASLMAVMGRAPAAEVRA